MSYCTEPGWHKESIFLETLSGLCKALGVAIGEVGLDDSIKVSGLPLVALADWQHPRTNYEGLLSIIPSDKAQEKSS